jgi:SpoIID/LytB domain protein
VLAGEALPGLEPAALEALAITIGHVRQPQQSPRRRIRSRDQTHCQVMRTATPPPRSAATATAGQVLLYRGAPATVYHSASCGGRTEKPSNVWPGADDPPYLPSHADDGCGGAPAWSSAQSRGSAAGVGATGFSGRCATCRSGSRNESGRVARLDLSGLSPAQISGQDLRAAIGRTLGWQYLQSATFDLKRSGDSFRFTGHGAGHGVGMCVIGSAKLAVSGRSTAQILGQYFQVRPSDRSVRA